MIQSAEYARLYEQLGQRLRDTRRFLDDAREQLTAIRAQIDAEEQDILSRAVRLPDGTYVFRGEDDRAYTRDGELSDHPDAKDIIWRDDHAKLSEIQHNEGRAEKADSLEDQLDRADAKHGDMTERYENTDEKMTPDEIEGAMQDLDDMVDKISGELSGLQESLSSKASPKGPGLDISVTIPEL